MKRFQDTIQFDSPLSTVPISLSQSSSPLLLGEIAELLQKQAVERVQDTGTPVFFIPDISCPKKELKTTSCNRSFSVESVHRETTIRNGHSQVSLTIDTCQWQGYLHRSDRCLSTCFDSSSFKEVPLFHVQKSGIPIHSLTFRNVPKLWLRSESRGRIVLIAVLWPHRPWFSGVLQLLASAPIRLPCFPNLLTQAKGRFQHQNLSTLVLHAWELSSDQFDKRFSQNCENFADFVSKSRRASTEKV